MKYSLRSLFVVVTLVCVLLGGRIEYLRRMAVFHERESDRARSLFAPDGYATDDEESFKTMMSHKKQAHNYRQAMYRPWTFVDDTP